MISLGGADFFGYMVSTFNDEMERRTMGSWDTVLQLPKTAGDGHHVSSEKDSLKHAGAKKCN